MKLHLIKTSGPSPSSRPPGPGGVWRRIVRGVLALGVAMVALGLVVLALLTTLLVGSAVLVWALIRGRRPAVGVFNEVYRRRRRQQGKVVDVEVREVVERQAK
jgi:hypothetical protein